MLSEKQHFYCALNLIYYLETEPLTYWQCSKSPELPTHWQCSRHAVDVHSSGEYRTSHPKMGNPDNDSVTGGGGTSLKLGTNKAKFKNCSSLKLKGLELFVIIASPNGLLPSLFI